MLVYNELEREKRSVSRRTEVSQGFAGFVCLYLSENVFRVKKKSDDIGQWWYTPLVQHLGGERRAEQVQG